MTALESFVSQYWIAASALNDRPVGRPISLATCFSCLRTFASQSCEYDHLRCAAGSTLVTVKNRNAYLYSAFNDESATNPCDTEAS